MKRNATIVKTIISNLFYTLLLIFSVSVSAGAKDPVELSDAEIKDIVWRTYQYVPIYNVNNKFAHVQGGWNTVHADTELKDHTTKEIARPNNDSLYIGCMLDLRKDPVIIDIPAFDSLYVSLMVTGYDHYVNVPLSVTKGDFKKPEKVMFYTARTAGYDGGPIEGVDRSFEMTGDFVSAVFRVMPHANDTSLFEKIKGQMQAVQIITLSEHYGNEPKNIENITFPVVGQTDLDVYENNFLEVMQFVVNHTTFDPANKLDKELLEVLKPLGVEPGKTFDPNSVATINSKKFKAIAEQVRQTKFTKAMDSATMEKYGMGWSSASAGPLDLFKMTVGEGGIRSPLLIAGPGIKGSMQNDSFVYVWDLMPTVLDFAGIKHPEQFNGNDVEPMMGKSLKTILTDTADSVYPKEAFVGGEMLNGKWMRQGDYKAVSIAAPYGAGTWHLYDIRKDPGETTDLAVSKPQLLQKLQDQWEIYADEVGVILTD